NDLQPDGTCGHRQILHLGLDFRKVWVHERGNQRGVGDQLVQKFQPFWLQSGSEKSCARNVAFGSIETGNAYRHLLADQLGRKHWQLIISTFGPSILEAHILSVNITSLAETSLECRHERCKRDRRARADETNYWCRRLLRVCFCWPYRRAAK